jgi:HEAT repeat protein
LQPAIATSALSLQKSATWAFDVRSALIGALLAWILVGLLYSQRKAIHSAIQSIWEPFIAWRRRAQASEEDKYVRALKAKLHQRLLYQPKSPDLILQEPSFWAPAPLPTNIGEAAQSPRVMAIPFARLLNGHKKVVITAPPASGRTAALVLTVWRATQSESENGLPAVRRLPFWIDAPQFVRARAVEQAAPAEHIADLVAATAPGITSKWILQQLRKESCLIVVDDWELLPRDDRVELAQWIAQADAQFHDTFWLIASGAEGYGDLVEIGFVPAQLRPPTTEIDIAELLAHWSHLLGIPAGDPPTEEALEALTQAAATQNPLWELHLRAILYLRTQELPERPVEVMGRILETNLEAVDLGKGQEAIEELARDLALRAIVSIAAAHRLERRAMTGQKINAMIEGLLPPKEERPRRLDLAVYKLIEESGVLVEQGKQWVPVHPLWEDYLTALHLALEENGEEMVHAHYSDPLWYVISEFYAGLADVENTVTAMINHAEVHNDRDILLRAVRWGIIAEQDRPWRTALTRSIAQTYMKAGLDYETRLNMAQALNLVAGEGARPFFLRMLRQPSLDLQRAALRGLGWARASRDMPILAAALRESQGSLQESAVLALCDTRTPGATTYLAQSLPNAGDALMLVIAEALAASPDGWQALEEASQHPDLMVRRAAAHGLGYVTQEWAREQLLEIAREDTEWLVRSAADSALQSKEERIHHQAQILAPPRVDQMDWLIAWAARQNLGLGVGDAALEMLGRAAKEGNVDAKILSALTLAQVGRESDLRILEPLLGEDDPDVQQAASWAVLRLRKRYQIYQGS